MEYDLINIKHKPNFSSQVSVKQSDDPWSCAAGCHPVCYPVSSDGKTKTTAGEDNILMDCGGEDKEDQEEGVAATQIWNGEDDLDDIMFCDHKSLEASLNRK